MSGQFKSGDAWLSGYARLSQVRSGWARLIQVRSG